MQNDILISIQAIFGFDLFICSFVHTFSSLHSLSPNHPLLLPSRQKSHHCQIQTILLANLLALFRNFRIWKSVDNHNIDDKITTLNIYSIFTVQNLFRLFILWFCIFLCFLQLHRCWWVRDFVSKSWDKLDSLIENLVKVWRHISGARLKSEHIDIFAYKSEYIATVVTFEWWHRKNQPETPNAQLEKTNLQNHTNWNARDKKLFVTFGSVCVCLWVFFPGSFWHK